MTTRRKKGAPEREDSGAEAEVVMQPEGERSPDEQEGGEAAQVAPIPLRPQPVRFTGRPLALKLARVMSQVRHVPKNGRNDFHGYDYIMESDLVDSLRDKLAQQGVAILPSIRAHELTPSKDHRGRMQYLATITLDMTFIDGASGDQMTTTWVGQGVDVGDKAYYKAYTGAFKYALLKTFLVSGEDDSPAQVVAPRRRSGGRGGR